MITKQQIDDAIAAHGQWKTRLKNAVETGMSEFDAKQVQHDNVCQFGKWLYSLPAADQQQPIWKEIRAAHAQFHIEAGRILDLAVTGRGQEAVAALDFTGNYGKITGKLVILLTRWRESAS